MTTTSSFRSEKLKRGRPGTRRSTRALLIGTVLTALILAGCGSSINSTPKATSNVAVTPDNPLAWQNPSMVQNPSKSADLAIAYQENSGYQSPICGIATSIDSGATWSARNLVGLGGDIPLPQGFDVCTDPKLAYGPGANLLYLYQVLSQKTFASYLYLTTSADGGKTFATPVQVDPSVSLSSAATGDQMWYPAIASRGTTVSVAFFRYTPDGNSDFVYVATSTDGGRSFAKPVEINPSTAVTSSYDTALAITGDGGIHLAWVDNTASSGGCGTNPKTYTCPGVFNISTSTDGGHSFASPVALRTNLNLGCPGSAVLDQLLGGTFNGRCDPLHYGGYPFSFPLQAGKAKRDLYVSWWEGDPQAPSRVFLATSHDGGATWSAPAQVPSPTTPADQQNRPALALTTDGRLDVVFYNRSTSSQDVYWVSTTDGRTFEAAVKVTDQASDPTIGAKMFNGVTLGEFLGLAAENNLVSVAWTDTRRGNTNTGKQDIYFGRVRL